MVLNAKSSFNRLLSSINVKVLLSCHNTKHLTPQLSTLQDFPHYLVFCGSLAKLRQSLIILLISFQMSHSAVTALCRAMKLACELYPSRDIAVCLDPYCGLGFLLWCLTGQATAPVTSTFNFVPCNFAFAVPFSFHSGISFILNFSVYSGHHTILIPPGDLETNPALWLSVVSQYKGKFYFLL